jgi:glycosyltransferase involved in cell wall biosynthesis
LKEIAGDAALLVDAGSPEEIAEAAYQVLSDCELRKALSAKALSRSQMFSWDKCARQTLGLLEGVAAN